MSQTTMKVSKETLRRLREQGKMGDSFENVVNRLLDDAEEMECEPEEESDEV